MNLSHLRRAMNSKVRSSSDKNEYNDSNPASKSASDGISNATSYEHAEACFHPVISLYKNESDDISDNALKSASQSTTGACAWNVQSNRTLTSIISKSGASSKVRNCDVAKSGIEISNVRTIDWKVPSHVAVTNRSIVYWMVTKSASGKLNLAK